MGSCERSEVLKQEMIIIKLAKAELKKKIISHKVILKEF